MIIITSTTQGVTGKAELGIQPTIVKIQVSSLDEGSTNDGSGGMKQGFIYNKAYQLEVTEFAYGTPKDNEIKWACKHTDENGETNIISDWHPTGRKVNFEVNNIELLGGMLTFHAYVMHKENGAKLEIWTHYRFRFLDRQRVVKTVEERVSRPSCINQNQTSLCGIAIVAYEFAKKYKDDYKMFICEMHQKGTSTIRRTNYNIRIDDDGHLVEYRPQGKSIGSLAFADYLFLVTIRDDQNMVWDYDPKKGDGWWEKQQEGSVGLTLPHIVKSLMKNILNFKDIHDETNLLTSKWANVASSVLDIQRKINAEYAIFVLINANEIMNNAKVVISIPNHWVCLENISIKDSQVNMKVFSWGELLSIVVNEENFKDGYYGYLAGK